MGVLPGQWAGCFEARPPASGTDSPCSLKGRIGVGSGSAVREVIVADLRGRGRERGRTSGTGCSQVPSLRLRRRICCLEGQTGADFQGILPDRGEVCRQRCRDRTAGEGHPGGRFAPLVLIFQAPERTAWIRLWTRRQRGHGGRSAQTEKGKQENIREWPPGGHLFGCWDGSAPWRVRLERISGVRCQTGARPVGNDAGPGRLGEKRWECGRTSCRAFSAERTGSPGTPHSGTGEGQSLPPGGAAWSSVPGSPPEAISANWHGRGASADPGCRAPLFPDPQRESIPVSPGSPPQRGPGIGICPGSRLAGEAGRFPGAAAGGGCRPRILKPSRRKGDF